jgi:GT2 family glycosyltransferase
MKVSISIATHNRASELRRTLDSLVQIDTCSVDDYEMLVVGNNCSDDTAEVARWFMSRFGERLRYFEEPNQGLSHARNRAVAECRFEIVAFLDDDVNVDPNWLNGLVKAFREENCAVVGGRAYLVYPYARPSWLSEKNEGLLSPVERGPVRRLAMSDELYGVNLSFQREWFDRVGLFRTDLGRMGTCLIGGEDVEILERIVASGGKLVYEPAAVVGHRVAPSRLRRKWFWSRCYWGKLGEARTEANKTSPLILIRRSTWLILRTSWLVLKETILQGYRSPEVFYQTTRCACHLGAWVGSMSRLWRRLKELLGRRLGLFISTESGDSATCQEKTAQSNIVAAKP